MLLSRRGMSCALLGAAGLALPLRARAQSTYPRGTVEIVVPFTAGGAVDITGRVIASGLSKVMDRTFVVINRPGANSNLGNAAVARARPDGATLLVSSIGLAANSALYRNIGYDPLTDLTPISLISNAPVGLFLNKSVPANTLPELLALLKARPDELNYASYGVGSSPHLAAEYFQSLTGTRMTHVPFNGNGPAINATLAGETHVIFCTTVAAGPAIESGQLKAIAFANEQRSRQLSSLPTFRELGLDFSMGTFFGLLGPAGLPRTLVEMLSDGVRRALQDAEVRRILESQGAEPVGSSPAEFASFLRRETERLTTIIRQAGIPAQ